MGGATGCFGGVETKPEKSRETPGFHRESHQRGAEKVKVRSGEEIPHKVQGGMRKPNAGQTTEIVFSVGRRLGGGRERSFR